MVRGIKRKLFVEGYTLIPRQSGVHASDFRLSKNEARRDMASLGTKPRA